MTRRTSWLHATCSLVLASLLLAGCSKQVPETPLTVFAAASLKESMDAASARYQAATGTPVRVSYAGSSALARQIAEGAPADVFVSADLDWMDWLHQRNLVEDGTRIELLANTLVLVGPRTNGTTQIDLMPGSDLLPMLGSDGRLAVALTDSVPAGKYAKAALQSLGMWEALQPRLAESENVRAALLLVANGEAPLGIVYGSDARAEPRVVVRAMFAEDTHPAIVYPAAVLKASSHADAAAFVQWLRSPEAATIFREHGFTTR